VNQFVEECRQEWKRLRVPDPVADEMAAELTADLDEAAAEGASPEEVVGRAASDPRSFAAAWAAERGVVPPQSLTARLRRRSPLPVAIAALTIVAAVGAALVVFASPNAAAPVAAVRLPSLAAYPTKAVVVQAEAARAEAARAEAARAEAVQAEAAHQMWVAAKARGRVWITEPDGQGSGVDIHRVGSILLIAGIGGVILLLPLLFWSRSRRFGPSSPQT
jgi:hypothetical protein